MLCTLHDTGTFALHLSGLFSSGSASFSYMLMYAIYATKLLQDLMLLRCSSIAAIAVEHWSSIASGPIV